MTNRTIELDPVPEKELSWCHEMIGGVSRTFALPIETLNEPISSYVCVGYLICRIADTIEDTNVLPPAEKIDVLEQYDRVLDPADDYDIDSFNRSFESSPPEERTADWMLLANSNRVLRTFKCFPSDIRDAILPPIRELINGMVMFVERHAGEDGIRIGSTAELEEYCYFVAGTIGQLMTNLIGRDIDDDDILARLEQTAVEFGLLLQLVNIAKDVHDDYVHENNVYLPGSWLSEVEVGPEDLLSSGETQAVVSVIERTTEYAQSYLDDAQMYLNTVAHIDETVYTACTIPYLLAVGTIRELSRRPEDALSPGGVKISRDEVATVVDVVKSDTDPRSLAELRTAIMQGELC